MTKRFLVIVGLLGFISVSLLAQSKPSIQGVWRVAEVTTTGPNAVIDFDPASGVMEAMRLDGLGVLVGLVVGMAGAVVGQTLWGAFVTVDVWLLLLNAQ